MTSLGIDHLVKKFGSVLAADDVSLQVAEGEILVLVGPSGCGKTTCLRCIAGLEQPTGGTIRLGQRVVSSAAERIFVPPEHREIGMVFQSYAVWPHMTVHNNVAYPLRALGRPRAEVQERVLQALKLVQLEHLADRYSSQISGGQQQRVALARSLVGEPKLLLFDEPLSNLDAGLRVQMRIEIKELQNRLGFTSVYVTHDQTEAMAIADRIAVMDRGVLQQVGSPHDIYDRPANAFVAGFMGSTNLLPGRVLSTSAAEVKVGIDGGLEVIGSSMSEVSAGDSVTVSIRPESIAITAAGTPISAHPNCWTASVTMSTFVGDQTIYRAQMGPHRMQIHARSDEHYDADAPVLLHAPVARCVVLKQ